MAEWSCSGLQSRVRRFDSDLSLTTRSIDVSGPIAGVQHFTDVNLYAAYQLNDHLQVHGSITNLFDSVPPVDLQTYGGGAELAYTTLDQDGAVDRFF